MANCNKNFIIAENIMSVSKSYHDSVNIDMK